MGRRIPAIAIATGRPYQEVCDALNELGRNEYIAKRKKRRSPSQAGVYRKSYQRYLTTLSWHWKGTTAIGSGCTVPYDLRNCRTGDSSLKFSGHLTVVVIDGVLYDTHDCSRHGTRCVYDYFSKP